jgi:hypothetical protein
VSRNNHDIFQSSETVCVHSIHVNMAFMSKTKSFSHFGSLATTYWFLRNHALVSLQPRLGFFTTTPWLLFNHITVCSLLSRGLSASK